MIAEEAKQAISNGKKVRRKGENGYMFSYDGINTSMITEQNTTLTDIKPISQLVLDGEFEEASSFRMPIEDFIKRFL